MVSDLGSNFIRKVSLQFRMNPCAAVSARDMGTERAVSHCSEVGMPCHRAMLRYIGDGNFYPATVQMSKERRDTSMGLEDPDNQYQLY